MQISQIYLYFCPMFSLAEENYLKTIYHLEQESKGGVSTNAIAERMETKPSSVTDMVQKLAEKKMLSYKKVQRHYADLPGSKNCYRRNSQTSIMGSFFWLTNSNFIGMKFTR